MAKTKKLAGRVNVGGEWYGPDDDVPADVAAKITNPKAWADTAADADGGEDGATRSSKGVKPGTASGARLVNSVNVEGVWYTPDSAIPDDVAAKITNPKAWEGGVLPGSKKGSSTPAASTAGAEATGTDSTATETAADSTKDGGAEKGGKAATAKRS